MSDNTILCASLPEAFASVAMTYPDKHMEPGKLSRFSTNGKPADTAGWCKLFADGVGASFGCKRNDTKFVWLKWTPESRHKCGEFKMSIRLH